MKSSPAEASGVEAASGPGVAAQQRPRTASQATTPSRATADDSEVVNSGSSDDPPQGTSQRPEVSARPTAASAAAAAPFSSRHGRAHDPRGGAFRRFREQTYDVFRPQPTLPGALAVLGVLFALGLGLGVPLLLASLRVVEIRVRYDNADPLGGGGAGSGGGGGNLSGGGDWDLQHALWASGDAGVRQSLTLTVPRAMRAPIYVMYELDGLYGTHKRYVRSVSWEQLKGGQPPAGALDMYGTWNSAFREKP